MGEVILKNRQKFDTNSYPVNFSVLKDPYFVVQPSRKAAPTCELVKLDFVKFNLCTFTKNDVVLNQVREKTVYVGDEIDTMVRLVQEVPNAALVDIGAHIGLVSAPVMVATNNKVKIIAVEASPINVQGYLATMEANGVPHDSYVMVQRAIADTVDESLSFHIPDGVPHNAIGTLSEKTGFTPAWLQAAPYRVLTATLDSHVLPVAKAMNITTAILKMDIEGCECLATRRAKKFLQEIFVPYILVELLHHSVKAAPTQCIEEMHKTLIDLSYHPFYIHDFGPRRMLNPRNYKRWRGRLPTVVNILWKRVF